MRTVTLTRSSSSEEGTFGHLITDSGYYCITGELPWRDNIPNKSCIPTGQYQVLWQWSQHHECNLYHVQEVPGRGNIEIHSANFMGEVDNGWACQLMGCIAPGASITLFKLGTKYSSLTPPLSKDQRGISASQPTLQEFHNDLKDNFGSQQPFTLTIQEA